jgi:hypothetical protein
MWWILGLLFSLLAGHFGTQYFKDWLRSRINLDEKTALSETNSKRIPPEVTGLVERSFFTIVVGVNLTGASTAMIGWLALKMATNWNHPDWKDKPEARSFAFSALLSGLVSMGFATLGGLICRL